MAKKSKKRSRSSCGYDLKQGKRKISHHRTKRSAKKAQSRRGGGRISKSSCK